MIYPQAEFEMINEEVAKKSMEALMGVAAKALDFGTIDQVVEQTEKVFEPMRKLGELVKLQQRNFADLQVKFALLQQNYEILKRQTKLATG